MVVALNVISQDKSLKGVYLIPNCTESIVQRTVGEPPVYVRVYQVTLKPTFIFVKEKEKKIYQ